MALVNNNKSADFKKDAAYEDVIPGDYHFADSEITINSDREAVKIVMENTGDRPVQIGSHYHLYEANDAIKFFDADGKEYPEREIVWGKRFDIPSSTSVRLEPGEKKEVNVIDYKGERKVYGMNNLVDGKLEGGPKQKYSEVIKERHEHFKRGK